MLQTCKADGLTAGSLVPTRLVTLAAVTGGLSSDAQRRAVDEGKACSMCRVDFGQPAATSTRARVIVNGCCHSYCKRCLSDLFIEARGEEFFCRHSSCRNRLQLGFLRELVDRGTYEASERALDDNAAWAALDKSCPPPCELEGFRVSMCDSFIADARAREGMLGRYAGTAQCEDGFDHVRILSKEFPRRPLAEADLIRPGSLVASAMLPARNTLWARGCNAPCAARSCRRASWRHCRAATPSSAACASRGSGTLRSTRRA